MGNDSTTTIAVISPKGGVGKTTLIANLADAMASQRQSVLAVDLDPQNALAFHLAADVSNANGLAVASLCGRPWSSALRGGYETVQVLPFGRIADRHRQMLQRRMREPGQWLADGLTSASASFSDVVLIDTPPGGSALQRAALAVADIVLVALVADAASLVAAPGTAGLLAAAEHQPGLFGQDGGREVLYVLNRLDTGRQLSIDVQARLAQTHGDALVPVAISHDPHVEDALARRKTVVRHNPDCAAAQNFQALARWLLVHRTRRAGQAGDRPSVRGESRDAQQHDSDAPHSDQGPGNTMGSVAKPKKKERKKKFWARAQSIGQD